MAGNSRGADEQTSSQPNHYQVHTTQGKLRGQYYTPDELVGLMLDGLHLTPQHLVIDPACGDGSFLRGVVAAVARRFWRAERHCLATHWGGPIVGVAINDKALPAARAPVQQALCQRPCVELPGRAVP